MPVETLLPFPMILDVLVLFSLSNSHTYRKGRIPADLIEPTAPRGCGRLAAAVALDGAAVAVRREQVSRGALPNCHHLRVCGAVGRAGLLPRTLARAAETVDTARTTVPTRMFKLSRVRTGRVAAPPSGMISYRRSLGQRKIRACGPQPAPARRAAPCVYPKSDNRMRRRRGGAGAAAAAGGEP